MTQAAVTYGLLHYCYTCPDAENCWSEEICQRCWEANGAKLEPQEEKVGTAVNAETAEQLRRYWE